jgi:hypothetical protein
LIGIAFEKNSPHNLPNWHGVDIATHHADNDADDTHYMTPQSTPSISTGNFGGHEQIINPTLENCGKECIIMVLMRGGG